MKHKNKHLIILLVLVSLSIPTFLLFSKNEEVAATNYSPFCTSQACRAAADREAAAQAKADAASEAANDLQGKVDSLNAEIEAIQAQIDANQAIADDLGKKITENEAKLDEQQAALADLLVKMHFDSTPNTIMILASSGSIGDFAEKQSRQETVKSQITESATAVKELKDQLAQQKAGVDAIIESQNSKRNEIAARRNEQSSLMARYKYNASAYAADAKEARKIKEQEIASEIARNNSSGNIGSGVNTYPYQHECPGANLSRIVIGGYICQCVSYTGWKVYEAYGISISAWGNASNWGNSARARGYRVDGTPSPGTVGYTTKGVYGHVVWVESVNGNGTINVTEYNNTYATGLYYKGNGRAGWAGDFGARSNVSASEYNYIHFN